MVYGSSCFDRKFIDSLMGVKYRADTESSQFIYECSEKETKKKKISKNRLAIEYLKKL